jgi:hypothetical protein
MLIFFILFTLQGVEVAWDENICKESVAHYYGNTLKNGQALQKKMLSSFRS